MTGQPATVVEARLETYLDQIAAGLSGPRGRRARVLAELRDGLYETVADRLAAGLPAEQAADAAIARFGTPTAIADAFTAELGTAYARHTIAWFIATGPLVGIWWLLLLHPHPWRTGPLALLAAIPVIPLIALAVATAAGTFATTGRLIRWLPEASPHRALAATMAVAALAITGDVAVIGLYVYLHTAIPAPPLAIIAIAASLVRIGCALLVIGRATALRRRTTNRAAPVPDHARR